MITVKLKIKIIALGKIKEKFLKSGIDEFLKRLTPYAQINVTEINPIEIKDENLKDKILIQEGEKILSLDQLTDELGITTNSLNICYEDNFKPYATELDSNGAVTGWIDSSSITITSSATPVYDGTVVVDANNKATVKVTNGANQTIKLDFYLAMSEKATQVTIAPDSFGGTFYVEADTLYRNQNGQDMAATLTFPKAKIQSGFTLSMSPTGDPSTFDFVMDAMPGYTYFDSTKKVVCDIMIVGDDAKAEDVEGHEKHSKN